MRALLTLTLAWVFAGLVIPTATTTQAGPTAPAFVTQGYVDGVSEVKFPHLAATGSTVHLAANSNRLDASHWSKADTDAAFGPATKLGPAEEQPDYSTTSIAAGPDGSLAYAWMNQPTRTISLRTKPVGGDWSAARTVAAGLNFGVFPEVAWSSDGAIIVAWRTPDTPFVYRRSTDGGASWGPTTRLALGAGINQPALAAGPDGQLAIAFAQGDGDRLQVFVATWAGSGFGSPQRVSSTYGDFADPSASYGPDGRLYVAWRGVADSGTSAGVFYSARQDDGSWPVAHLIGGKVAGKATILADVAGNLHLIWTASPNGPYQVWYSVKPAAGAWSAPVAAPVAAGTLFNASAAVSIGADGALSANVASEVFYGSSVLLRHYRFSSGLSVQAAPSAAPALDGAAATTAKATIPLTFTDVAGDPALIRVHWGAAPTDADPWQPFGPLGVPVPATVSGASCAPLTLFTQVRSAAGLVGDPAQATITLDQAVQASLTALGAGAPGYTNQPSVALQVDAQADCSGIASAHLLGSTQASTPTAAVFALTAPIRPTEGLAQAVGVELRDALGSTRTLTTSVVYDATPPAFTPGGPLVITPDPNTSILAALRLPVGSYADASGARPWALQVAVAPAGSIQATTPLAWATVPLTSGAGGDLTASVNLADFFPRDQLAPGSYIYTVRVLDMAGNPAEATASGTIALDRITFFDSYIPQVTR